MINKRRVLILTIILVVATITAASATNILNEDDKKREHESGKYTLRNDNDDTMEVYKGIVYEDEEIDSSEEKIKYILKDKETGHFFNVFIGEMNTEEVEDNFQIITPNATSKPTEIIWENYTHDWSDTVNFTYTEYAFPSGNFVAWADQPFSVVLYDYEYNTSFPRIYAEYINNRYEVETGGGDFSYYCTLSNTNKGEPMTNAVYKSIPHWWHDN